MYKERKVIEPDAVIIFDRSVKTSELNSLIQDFYGDVVITQKLFIDKDLDIKCNLHVIGDIICKNRFSEHYINISGDLYCYGKISCYDIYVSGCFYCEGIIYSSNIRVGENLCCYNTIHAYGNKIAVAGNMLCYGIITEELSVLGEIKLKGSISVSKLIETGY